MCSLIGRAWPLRCVKYPVCDRLSVDKVPFPGGNLAVWKAWVLPSEGRRVPTTFSISYYVNLGNQLTQWVGLKVLTSEL